ncbi:hypothetical protein Ndes2526B_g07746 [Nannochloris sp. 'desiccata']|nr:hypothetical protein NADE_006940 [Chlorella desiccata (nom. nud.)]
MNRSAILLCVALCFVVVTNAQRPSGPKAPKICERDQGWIMIEKQNDNVDPQTVAVLSNDASNEGVKIAIKKGCAIERTKLQRACEQILPGGTSPVYQYQAISKMRCPGKKPGKTNVENVKFTRNYPRPDTPTTLPQPI